MASIFDFFGYRAADESEAARQAAEQAHCPFLNDRCEKTFNDGTVAGVCSVKPVNDSAVICCPVRLYAEDYKILRDVSDAAFTEGLELINGLDARSHSQATGRRCVAVFGKRWGGELHVPKREGGGKYFVDWILALLDETGQLEEFVAVEVQTIDTTGTYRDGYELLMAERLIKNTTAGLNWENVNKRILPQLVYKGQVLQREEMCKKGLFFVCPEPVYDRIMGRLGGREALVAYRALQPAALTFLVYDYAPGQSYVDGEPLQLAQTEKRTTTVYRLQEAFNNVTLPADDVYTRAIQRALDKAKQLSLPDSE
ncbi:hypothetical protein MW338_003036 [Pseudomonas aeruginosa]|uniref:NotI family restriction endonuclease n=1 Tax=Metapseudomonas otitidis TaxID=319939 RepID=UPI002E7B58ED|nr:NotI family restriction endonuclease [Pseudomonas otitidis]EJB8396202.1 hypothetical protein [Pseudomonas aeruginosa]MEE1893030.1 NotI family restriction endonuclease [Pseudomonas otitidis]